MAFKDIFNKLGSSGNREPPKKGMSPSEVEVRSFREQERQDNLKKELGQFRKKASNELLTGNMLATKDTITTQKTTILKNRSMKPQKSILGPDSLKTKNVFFE